MEAALSYAEAETLLRRRIADRNAALHRYQCSNAKAHARAATRDLQAYLGEGEHEIAVLVIYLGFYAVVIPVAVWLVGSLLLAAVRGLHFSLLVRLARKRWHEGPVTAHVEGGRHSLSSAARRGALRRIYRLAWLELTVAALLLLGLGSLQALTSALVRGVLAAWWASLTGAVSRHGWASAAFRALLHGWRRMTITDDADGMSDALDHSDPPHARVSDSPLWGLVRSGQSLFLWSTVGCTLLTLAVSLLAAAAARVRGELTETLHRHATPLLDQLDSAAAEAALVRRSEGASLSALDQGKHEEGGVGAIGEGTAGGARADAAAAAAVAASEEVEAAAAAAVGVAPVCGPSLARPTDSSARKDVDRTEESRLSTPEPAAAELTAVREGGGAAVE